MMKKLVIILFVFISVSASAQAGKKSAYGNNQIVVNGELFSRDLSIIPIDSILIVNNISKKNAAYKFPEIESKDGITEIITKDFAIKQYQKKLRAFSARYAIYLNAYGPYDGDIYYDIDGEHSLGDDMLRALYNLPAKRIKGVVFIKDYMDKGRNVKVVTIHTKNN
jgi:hypothetical protein